MAVLKRNYFIFCIFFLVCGLLSVHFGLDNTTELKLYHLWNAHAFVTGRHSIDFAYVGLQSYFNPLADLPYYYLAKILNNFPKLFLFLQGFWGALILFFLYKIIDLLIIEESRNKYFLIIGSLFAASTSYLFFYELGTSLLDLQLCFLPLWGIYVLFKELCKQEINYKNIAISGLLFGLATGLKLTLALHALAMFLALLFYIKRIHSPFKFLFAFCFGGIVGFLITIGYWCYFLWTKFGNPFFPYYGNIFPSEYAENGLYICDYFFPQKWTEWIAFPFFFYNNNQARVFEEVYRDHRYTIGYIIFVVYLFCQIFNFGNFREKIKEKFQSFVDIDKVNLLMLFMTFSYVIWIIEFSIIRYLALVELLLGFIILLFLFFICSVLNLKKIFVIFVAGMSLFLYTTTIQIQKRVKPYNVIFDVQDIKIPDNAIVLSYGMPACFVSVFQNPNVKYIHGFIDMGYSFLYSEKTKAEMQKLMDENKDNIYAIWGKFGQAPYPFGERERPEVMIPDFYLDFDSCKSIYNNNEEIVALCKIYKKE